MVRHPQRGSEGTTPVGAYGGRGDSPYGCTDMACNVREWTRSLAPNTESRPLSGSTPDKGRLCVLPSALPNSRIATLSGNPTVYAPGMAARLSQ
ncbi:MAG: SUMF1/EgtB/PvdO family nonheme iron enzyme [Anaerolineae bacterium]|nr:SUMF1/EgtB/PvdO family nonheme iron enzyme [Anaerolineae bacterium]